MSFKKTLLALVGVSLMLAVVAVPATAKADALSDAMAQLAILQAQIALLQNGGVATTGGSTYDFTRNLTVGSTGPDVMALQKFLNSKGFTVATTGAGSAGMESSYFGPATKAALMKYQAQQGGPATGYFGPITQAYVRAMTGTVTPPGTTTPGTTTPGTPSTPGTGALEGGAGSVSEYSLMSGLNNEEVGEDEEDVEVAGLEIEADDSSDIEITSVKLVFDEGTAGSDFEDYATEVSVWFGGEEVARVDANEFDDDNDWTKTLSLDDGVIVKADATEELTVAVSGIGNLDTNDATDTWTVDFRQIRFRDAEGDSTSEDPNTDARTFSFESFATAVNAELKISENDDDINDARVIDVEANDDKDNVVLASFFLEAEGDSDLTIKKFAASTTVTGASHVDDLINNITLWIDGEEVATGEAYQDADGVSVGSVEDYLFDDMEYTIKAGDKLEAEIRADFNSVADALDEGDTIAVDIKEDLTDQVALVKVEDESGENLADGDITGSVTAGAHSVYDSAVQVKFISQSATEKDVVAGIDDIGEYKIVFDVTAFGADIFIDGDIVATSAASVVAGADGTLWGTTTDSTNGIGTSTAQARLASVTTESNDVTTAGSLSFEVPEDETRRFTLYVDINGQASESSAGVRLRGINWDTDSGDAHANLYTFDLGEFKTENLTLTNR